MTAYKAGVDVYIENDETGGGVMTRIMLNVEAGSTREAIDRINFVMQRLVQGPLDSSAVYLPLPLRAGDKVRHLPSGEKWVLAYARGVPGTPDRRVSACGWPESEAYAKDCILLEACTDEEHEKMLREWAEKPHNRDDGSQDYRKTVCETQLEALLAQKKIDASGLGQILGAIKKAGEP